jgi:hypothetical protein
MSETEPVKLQDKEKCLYTWALLNVPFFLIITAGFVTGKLQPLFHDVTYLTHVIFGLFILTVGYTGYLAVTISTSLDNPLTIKSATLAQCEALKAKLGNVLHLSRFMANLLVGLGFLGTILGIIIGFQYFPSEAFTDPSKMQEFVRYMLTGFAVELHTLLAGLVAKLWLSIVNHALEQFLMKLYIKTVGGNVR